MSEFIGWQWFVIAMSSGVVIGIGLAWWQTSRELRKIEKENGQ
jgi:hypothetical protein